MIVVADTSPVLHLARIGQLELIPAVFGHVLVPRMVWRELVDGRAPTRESDQIRNARWIEVREDPPIQELGLDAGETAAILLAEAAGADAIIIDERKGRAIARHRGIAVVGTLGVVAGAKQRGAIERVRPVLDQLRSDGFWLSDAVVEEFLKAAGET